LSFGRYGRDAERFPIFLGTTELLRGYTYGSFRDNECIADPGNSSQTGCAELDQLIGSKIAVANVELRFPLTRSLVLGFLPIGFPPIEAAVFYDAGLAWSEGSVVKLNRAAGENPALVRAPLKSWGGSIRVNMLGLMILRFDYTKPIDRPLKKNYWTISLGPTF
jgi:outer membrane protein assembly factor BamA